MTLNNLNQGQFNDTNTLKQFENLLTKKSLKIISIFISIPSFKLHTKATKKATQINGKQRQQ